MPQPHAFHGWSEGISGEHDSDEPSRIRLQGEVAEVEKKPGASDEVGGVGDVRGRLRVHLGFGRARSALVVDHAHLQFADAGKVFVEFFAVLTADLGAEGMGLSADVVENATPIIKPLKLGLPRLLCPTGVDDDSIACRKPELARSTEPVGSFCVLLCNRRTR